MVDYPRGAIRVYCVVLNFRLNRIYSFEDSVIFYIFTFSLKQYLFTTTFRWFEGICPQMMSHIADLVPDARPNPGKGRPCAETHRLSHKA